MVGEPCQQVGIEAARLAVVAGVARAVGQVDQGARVVRRQGADAREAGFGGAEQTDVEQHSTDAQQRLGVVGMGVDQGLAVRQAASEVGAGGMGAGGGEGGGQGGMMQGSLSWDSLIIPCQPNPPVQAQNHSSLAPLIYYPELASRPSVSGNRAASRRSCRAAPVGSARPCSQFSRVRFDTPSARANSVCDSPD
jgi:hypothetical protein